MTNFEPGTYVNGDRVRIAYTARDAAKAVWEGFVRATPDDTGAATRAELQAQAKGLGIAANQSSDALRDAIANFVPPVTEDETPVDTEGAEFPGGDNPDAPETGAESPLT